MVSGESGMMSGEWGMVNAKCVRLPPSKIVGEWGIGNAEREWNTIGQNSQEDSLDAP